MDDQFVDVSFECTMRYHVLNPGEAFTGIREMDSPCPGKGIITHVDRGYLERSRQGRRYSNERELRATCPECGMLLNWFSGKFREV